MKGKEKQTNRNKIEEYFRKKKREEKEMMKDLVFSEEEMIMQEIERSEQQNFITRYIVG